MKWNILIQVLLQKVSNLQPEPDLAKRVMRYSSYKPSSCLNEYIELYTPTLSVKSQDQEQKKHIASQFY